MHQLLKNEYHQVEKKYKTENEQDVLFCSTYDTADFSNTLTKLEEPWCNCTAISEAMYKVHDY